MTFASRMTLFRSLGEGADKQNGRRWKVPKNRMA